MARASRAVVAAPAEVEAFADDLRAGLLTEGQKKLPSRWLYDEVGSALFEVISLLPEYGLTRADERLLRRHAPEIAARAGGPAVVAELGSGSGRKTRWILEALRRRRALTYYPIDVSASALDRCARELADLAGVSWEGFEGTYLDGLAAVAASRPPGGRLLVLFLGSTLGNFDRLEGERFLRQVGELLLPQDRLLLGTDLVKPEAALLAAYDDPAGVTAAFDRNLLARANRELDAEFLLPQFEHLTRWDARARRIEMHLRSRVEQTVAIHKADLRVQFRAGETIWTESSHKFTPAEVARLAARAGFRCEAQWLDDDWPFAESLLVRPGY